MAKLWIVHREGLRVLGAVVAELPLPEMVGRIDLAPWRIFTTEAPEALPLPEVMAATQRKRALVEVDESDRYDLCGLAIGFFESPYSPAECLRRLKISPEASVAR
jgi:hypothetical protein